MCLQYGRYYKLFQHGVVYIYKFSLRRKRKEGGGGKLSQGSIPSSQYSFFSFFSLVTFTKNSRKQTRHHYAKRYGRCNKAAEAHHLGGIHSMETSRLFVSSTIRLRTHFLFLTSGYCHFSSTAKMARVHEKVQVFDCPYARKWVTWSSY